ncbi:kettin homolog isoform X2 [Gordionus sp. m RMFG-2023]|uniref:kettin homolog isoform X2 n=1 Tax=Gordionus sp. m RMFG-2023 TaxID=3053472 RepID=UPI0031FC1FC5
MSAPKISQITGDTNVMEGDEVLLECKVEPADDPNLKIDWFHNGRPVIVASRFETVHDMDYAALDISPAFASDSGTYVCKATNRQGQAQAKIDVTITDPSDAVLNDVILSAEGYQKILDLEAIHIPEEVPEEVLPPPTFVQELADILDCQDGDVVRFEARVEPANDPSLRIEWHLNGQRLDLGSRFKPTFDFGFVSLEISPAINEYSGNYTCKAINNSGEATSSAVLQVQGEGGVFTESQNPEGLEKIKQLEAFNNTREWVSEVDDRSYEAPKFINHISDMMDLKEGDHVNFKCDYKPTDDPELKVEWYFNDKPLIASNRISCLIDNGYALLEIVGVKPEDSGLYVCKISNKVGEDTTQASLECSPDRGIFKSTILPNSLRKIRELESYDKPHTKLSQRRMQMT